jgi:hypothetical protein
MEHGVLEAYEDSQLAVAISDLAVVRGALEARAVGVEGEEQDQRLGLALLTLGGVAAAAAQLRATEGKMPDASWTTGLTSKTPIWPGAFDEVIAVGATDGDELAAFSPRTPWVDLTAPGVGVESTYLTGQVKSASSTQRSPLKFNGFAYWNGTSFAAAAVSGAVAAKIRPGRCDVRQALACILKSPEDGIRPFMAPGS